MSVKLRKKKGKTGKISLYLDIYHNSKRQYEFLKLYLHKASTPLERDNNKQVLRLAESIRSKRELELNNLQHGFTPQFKSSASFIDYFIKQSEKRKKETNNRNWHSVIVHLKTFSNNNDICFGEITEQWLNNFKEYLLSKLSHNAAAQYFSNGNGYCIII